ncbi:MAG: hypothetical protein LQ345_002199 [Seirophora villosa]|nr:MAG: hypothetical protein LQ345_002199 [Seirophora villosa]
MDQSRIARERRPDHGQQPESARSSMDGPVDGKGDRRRSNDNDRYGNSFRNKDRGDRGRPEGKKFESIQQTFGAHPSDEHGQMMIMPPTGLLDWL